MDAIVQMINPAEVNSADTPSSLPLKPEMKLPQNVKTIPSTQIFTIVLFFIHQSIVTIVTIVNCHTRLPTVGRGRFRKSLPQSLQGSY
jgi:hypothetical protein